MIIAKRYDILRGVEANGRRTIALTEEPCRLVTVLNEAKFLESGGHLVHNDTVFFEDKMHDWQWKDGHLRYYTRIAPQADVIVVYEEENTLVPSVRARRRPGR